MYSTKTSDKRQVVRREKKSEAGVCSDDEEENQGITIIDSGFANEQSIQTQTSRFRNVKRRN